MGLSEPYDDNDKRDAKERQRSIDLSTIKVRLIENGILVSSGPAWFTFTRWEGGGGAADHIAGRLDDLRRKRATAPKGA